jgi:plastocyanin
VRRVLLAAALALCAAAPAGAHPGQGTEFVTVDGTGLRYTPDPARIAVGEAVLWTWRGSTLNHSVTADPGQEESFDSDPSGTPNHSDGDTFSHEFTHQGTFTYYCRNYPTMQGVVDVIDLTVGAGPFRFKAVKAKPRRNHLVVRFRLTARGDLVARIAEKANGRWRTVKTLNRRARKGQNELELPLRALEPGRHRLTLTAYDSANRRTEAREMFKVPR